METRQQTHDQDEPPELGEYGGHAIYPMPLFVRLETADILGTVAFFTGALDFDVVFRGPELGGTPVLVHLRRRKYQDILVVPAAGDVRPGTSLTVNFAAADADEIDALAARAGDAAPGSVDGPVDTPWNTRDVTVTDPNSNRFVFTARDRAPRPGSIDEIMRRAKDDRTGP